MGDTELLPVLKRWWWALALGGLLAALAGLLIASSLPKTYEAEERMLVGPVNSDVALEASGALARTYEELATSTPVLAAAIRSTDADMTARDLSEEITTTSNEITRTVTVAVRDEDPRMAARLASAIGRKLRSVANGRPPRLTAALEAFADQRGLSRLTDRQLERVLDAAAATFGPASAGRLSVVDGANVPPDPVAPVVPLIVLLSGVLGVILAGFVVVGREAASRRRLDARALAGLDSRFLGTVQAPRTHSPGRALPVETRPESPAAEQYRLLAARLRLFEPEPKPNSVHVVDGTDGTLAAVVAANLAVAVAQAGRSVLLVDTNAGGTGLTSLLGMDGQPGYAEIVGDPRGEGRKGIFRQLGVRRSEGLRVLPVGAVAAPHLIGTARAREVLGRISAEFDVVVLAGAPPSRSPAALAWSEAAGMTVLALDDEEISEDLVAAALQSLGDLNGRFAGTVLGHRRDPVLFAGRRAPERRKAS